MILIEKVHSTYFVPFRYKSKHRCITMHNVITPPPPTFTYIATSATQTDTMSRLAPPPCQTHPTTYIQTLCH